MFIIEVLKDGEWNQASSHSQEIDREAQRQRFIDNGVLPDDLRYKESE